MKIDIDFDRCEGHGLCVETAPEVYDLDDDALVVLKVVGEIPAYLELKAEAGARVCPVTALRVLRVTR